MLRKTIIASLVTAGAVATAIVVRSLLNDTLKQAEEEDAQADLDYLAKTNGWKEY